MYNVPIVLDGEKDRFSRIKAKSQITEESLAASENLQEQFVDKDIQLARLQNEVMYLRQELEFIKKL